MNKHLYQRQLPPAKFARQRCSEWVFQDVPSDITVEVEGSTFSLHRFPLVSRSGRIRKLVAENRDTGITKIELLDLPGGPDSFELAAQFCYGLNFEITSANVALLYCTSHYLEMTEAYSGNNLLSRTEEYLDSVVCKSLDLSLQVLKHCEPLLPLADELHIVTHCVDAIASKACAEQIASSFSRLEYSSSGRLHMSKQLKKSDDGAGGDWWAEDLSGLRPDLYERVILAMKCRGLRPESIGASLVRYAQKQLTRTKSDEKFVVETIARLLPVENFGVPLSFLFGLLRSAAVLDCEVSCRLNLERRIGSQLDMATIDDLLIPSFNNAGDTLFNVDCVQRIVVNFCQLDDSEDELDGIGSAFGLDSGLCSPSQSVLFKVSRLIDGYLAEIAADANLRLSKFVAVAESLPGHSRTVHDGLYRAIDIYLKAHPSLTDADRRKLCKLIDFQKLSPEAGAHAAQNERLPLQSMVQVLYYEQLRLRDALFGPYPDDKSVHDSWRISSGAVSGSMSPRDNYASLRRENRELKQELTRLRMRLNDLERDHVCMRKDMEKTSSKRFMSSFSKNMVKLNVFGHGSTSSRGSTSPAKHEPKFMQRKDTYL